MLLREEGFFPLCILTTFWGPRNCQKKSHKQKNRLDHVGVGANCFWASLSRWKQSSVDFELVIFIFFTFRARDRIIWSDQKRSSSDRIILLKPMSNQGCRRSIPGSSFICKCSQLRFSQALSLSFFLAYLLCFACLLFRLFMIGQTRLGCKCEDCLLAISTLVTFFFREMEIICKSCSLLIQDE